MNEWFTYFIVFSIAILAAAISAHYDYKKREKIEIRRVKNYKQNTEDYLGIFADSNPVGHKRNINGTNYEIVWKESGLCGIKDSEGNEQVLKN